jgi:hypothetical protein
MNFEHTWEEAIFPAARDCGLSAYRADVRKASDSILVDILDGIAHAKLVLVDVSPVSCSPVSWFRSLLSPALCRPQYPNGNVMYELGLAHASRQAEEVILVRNCSETRLLFDVSSVRVHHYPASDIKKSRQVFENLIRDALTTVDRTKSLQVAKAAQAITIGDINLIRKFWPDGFNYAAKDSDENLNDIPSSHDFALGNLQKLGLVRTEPLSNNGKISINFIWTEFGNAVVKALGPRVFQERDPVIGVVAKPESPKAEDVIRKDG